jgi:soluble lytic murein transglycosylase-like protein
MQVESCGDPQAESPSGALGLFQVMPFHFKPADDPLDPETNAARGLGYLAEGLRQAQGRVDLALAGYNGGHGLISRPPDAWPDETRRYVGWTTSILAGLEAASTYSPGLQAWLAAGGQRLCAQASLIAGPAIANVATRGD